MLSLLSVISGGKKHASAVCNDSGVCFLGETSSFISYADLSAFFNLTQGILCTNPEINKWLRFTLDGKELYVSKVHVRNTLSWQDIYVRGLVYGIDGTGPYPSGTPVNQLKTITIAGKLYKCRLLKSCNPGTELDPLEGDYDAVITQQSEFSRLIYPVVIDDANALSYTGPRLAGYTSLDLNLHNAGTFIDGNVSFCQEGYTANPLWKTTRGQYGGSYRSIQQSTINSYNLGWRPCLELVE